MVYYDFMKGLEVTDTFESLVSTFGQNAPCGANEYNWYNGFKRGRKTPKDDNRPAGRIVMFKFSRDT